MTLVGFKRAVLGIYDDYWNIIKTHVFDGKTDEGATVTAEISGLSSEPIKTYSPSTAFNLLVVGTDDVTVNLSVIDMSVDFESAILGYNKKTNLFYGGETTSPPYVSLLLESSDIRGDKVFLGFFRGKTVLNDLSMRTETTENEELEATTYTMYFESNENNDTYIKGIGENAEDELKDLLFPGAFPSRPYNLQASNIGYSNFDLSWEHSTSKKFNVYLNGRLHTTTPYKTITIDGLSENTNYYVSVTSIGSAGESDPTATIKVKTKEYVSLPPENPYVTEISYDKATFVWTNNSADKYSVYLDSEFYKETTDSYIYISDLKPNSSHTVKVRAYKFGKWSDFSKNVTFSTKKIPTVTINNVYTYPTSIRVLIDSHDLQYKTFLNNKEITKTGNDITFDTLTPSTQYTLKFVAVYNGITSEETVKTVETAAIPQVTNLTTKDVTMTTATATWSGSSQSYEVYLNNSLKDTITETSYKFTGLSKDTSYTVKIIGIYDSYKSEPVESSFKTQAVPVPYELKTTYLDYKVATVSWKGQGDSFNVYVNGKLEKNTSDKLYTFSLIPENEYTVQISIVLGEDEGAKSDKLVFKAKQVPSVTDLRVYDSSIDRLSFVWKGVTENYEVTFNGKTSMTTDASFSANNLEQDKTYKIRVRAAYSGKFSLYEELEAKTTSVPIPEMEAIPFEDSVKVNLTGGTGQYEVKIDNDPYTLIDGNTHEFKDLVADTEYIVYARSVYKGSYSQAITENVTTEMLAIDKPVIKQAWANLDSVTLVMENTAYQYSISVDGGSTKTYGSTAVITGLSEGTSYKFTIKSLSGGNYSEPVEITRNTANGTEVTNIGHVKLSKDTAKFFWTGSGQSFDVMLDGSDERYTGSEQTCEFDGLEDGKDYRLTIIQNVDGKWSTWYYYNFRLEDETVISDDKPTEPTIEIKPPKNLTTSLITQTSARVSFTKDVNAEKTNIYLNDTLNGSTANSYYDLTSLKEDTSYSVYGKSVLDGKESEKSETITFKTDKKVGNTIADRVTFEPEVSLAKYRRSTGSSLIPYSVRSHKVDIKGLQTDETFNVETYNMFMYTKEKHTRDSFTMGLKSLYYDSEFVSTDKIQIEFSDGSKTEYTFNFEIE